MFNALVKAVSLSASTHMNESFTLQVRAGCQNVHSTAQKTIQIF
jgi:hypothetical protein